MPMRSGEFASLVKNAIDADLALARSKNPDKSLLEETKFLGLYPLLLAKRQDPSLPILVSLNLGCTTSRVPERIHEFSQTTGDVCLENPYRRGTPYYLPFRLDTLQTDQAYDDIPELTSSIDVMTELIGKYSPRQEHLDNYYQRSVRELMAVQKARGEANQEGNRTYAEWTLGISAILIERFLHLRAEPTLRDKILVVTDMERGSLGLRYNNGIYKATIPLGSTHPKTPFYRKLIENSGGFDKLSDLEPTKIKPKK